ncbi:Riboflavin biosynthesis protein RibBA (plasmid) [Rhodococcus ruber]|uniref:3,4-dihydroxy-2-butanone-4-phosphate synthase n=1 Tax=Rhodococcus ruber TaxID=1830 RepID=UPI00315DAEB8
MSIDFAETALAQRSSHRATADPVTSALSSGKAIVVTRRGSSFLVYAADQAEAATTAFAIRHGSGFLEVVLPVGRCDALQIPEAIPSDRDTRLASHGQCIGVDAAQGVGTGISAHDRARTARVLAAEAAVPSDLTRPGHVIVVRADLSDDTIFGTALQLVRAAGRASAAVLMELVDPIDPTRMADAGAGHAFAARHQLAMLDLV